MEALSKASHKLAEMMYKDAAANKAGDAKPSPEGEAGKASAETGKKDEVVDADYEVVDDKEKKKD